MIEVQNVATLHRESGELHVPVADGSHFGQSTIEVLRHRVADGVKLQTDGLGPVCFSGPGKIPGHQRGRSHRTQKSSTVHACSPFPNCSNGSTRCFPISHCVHS